MKKMFFLLSIFFCSMLFVNADSYMKFSESKNLNNDGFFVACSSSDGGAYCFSRNYNSNTSHLYFVDYSDETATLIKKFDENMNTNLYFDAIEKVDSGFIVVALKFGGISSGTLSFPYIYVYVLNNDYEIVSQNAFNYGSLVSGSHIVEIDGAYYVVNPAIANDGNYAAIKVSKNLKNISLVNVTDDEKYDYINSFNEVSAYYGIYNSIISFDISRKGYLYSVYDVDNGNSILGLYNKEIVWTKDTSNVDYGNIIASDDYFYVSCEKTSKGKTSFEKHDYSGDVIEKYDIDLLNDNTRFLLSNFIIDENNGTYYMFSYSYEVSNNPTDWTKFRLFKIDVAKSINVETLENGTIKINESAFPGEEVTIDVTPNDGYTIENIKILDVDGNEVEVKDGKFIMPNSSVTISVEFDKIVENKIIDVVKNPNTWTFGLNICIVLLILSAGLIIFSKIIRVKRRNF